MLICSYLDVHFGAFEQTQCGVTGAIRTQRHKLFQLLQVQSQFGTSAINKEQVGVKYYPGINLELKN